MTGIAENLRRVQVRVEAACRAVRRPPESVRIVAVSKTFSVDAVREAVAAGQTAFGESYVQEALPKIERLAPLALEWHFIGPVQSNKTRDIAVHFDWVHAVDRLKIAQRLSEQRPEHQSPLQVCVQVNISGEASKSGCRPEDTAALCHAVAALPRLRLRGLMCIPAPARSGTDPRAEFGRLRALFESIAAHQESLDTLSAGMSDDLEDAIAEGATLIRIGSAIFGERRR